MLVVLIGLVVGLLGPGAATRTQKVCFVLFYLCLSLLILDGLVAWYARKLNPDGYALIYPAAVALVLFPLFLASAILFVFLKIFLSRKPDQPTN